MLLGNSKKFIFSLFLFLACSLIGKAEGSSVTLKLKRIHFDFDKSSIKPDYQKELVKYADELKQSKTHVKIDGHCDTRGTTQYNMALGERRANSVKSFLVNLGVEEELLSTVSYGEEKRLCDTNTEECHAQNRRAELIREVSIASYYKNFINIEIVDPIQLKKDNGLFTTRVGINYNRIFADQFMATIGFLTDKNFEKTSTRGLIKVGLSLVGGEKKNASAGFNVLFALDGDAHLQPNLGYRVFLTDKITLNLAANLPTFKLVESETSHSMSGSIGFGYNF